MEKKKEAIFNRREGRLREMQSRSSVSRRWLLRGPLPISWLVDIVCDFMGFDGVCVQETYCPDWVNAIAAVDRDNFVTVGKRVRLWRNKQERCLGSQHTDMVLAVAVLGSGKFATGSWDHSVNVWDTDTQVGALRGHMGAVTCLARLGDACVVSGSSDKTVRVWDHMTNSCLRVLSGHAKTVWCVTVMPDMCIASGSADHSIKMWSSAEPAVFNGHTDWVMALAVLDDGTLVSGSLDCTVRVWNAQHLVCRLFGVALSLSCMPGNVVVCACGNSEVVLMHAGEIIHTFRQPSLYALTTWKKNIIVGTKNGHVRVFE